jgi:ribosomal silencing factor RsfS
VSLCSDFWVSSKSCAKSFERESLGVYESKSWGECAWKFTPTKTFCDFRRPHLILSARDGGESACFHRDVEESWIARRLPSTIPPLLSMQSLRAASSRFVCNACQKSAAQSLKAPLNGLPQRGSLKTRSAARKLSRCAFSSSSLRAKNRDDPVAEDPEFAFLEEGAKDSSSVKDARQPSSIHATETAASSVPLSTEESPEAQEDVDDMDELEDLEGLEELETAEAATPARDASIPWYLRQQSSMPASTQKPADIPDLPANPPPLLATILEYVSMTAGLDDLLLLDLRHLDPPPALGPKLIMIIATARSEKHLHVAADRFSRWLRRDHGLKANAAGLLGRNELKIKLRRKAKRMRMLANVGGAIPEGNIDDGIRTGWICCTLSKIEAHPDDMHMPGDNVQEFVGFRDVKPGVNVVVQMFTEEKRAETDLETLWGGVLRTHQRQDRAADDHLRELEDGGFEDIAEAESNDHPSPRADSMSLPEDDLNMPPTLPQPTRRLKPTPGDPFPDFDGARQLRRLHTVGLR